MGAGLNDCGGNNIDADPLFVGGPTGVWTADASYDAVADRSVLTDAAASFTADTLRGRALNPDATNKLWFYVSGNSSSEIEVRGNATTAGRSGKTYSVFDAHEQSEAGHWIFGNKWTNDTQTSPCIDTGDPTDSFAAEPDPNGGRINMGAYGNTPQASKKLTLPPDPVARLLALAEDGRVRLLWENPPNASFIGVLVLRKTSGYPSASPTNGTAYSVPGTLGDADIVYVGPGSTNAPNAASGWTDTSVANGIRHYYMVFARDSFNQYSAGRWADTTPSAAAGASPIYVDDSATGANNGTSWGNAYTSLVVALAQATNGMQVWVADGLYKPGSRRKDAFTPATNVTVIGGFASGQSDPALRNWMDNPSVLSGDIPGDNSYHVIWAAAPCVFDGFYVRDGYANGIAPDNDGGGAYLAATNVRLQNCVFSLNHADNNGAAILPAKVRAIVSNCVFAANDGQNVIYLSDDYGLYINSLFLFNPSNLASVIFVPSGKTGNRVINCTFARNGGIQLHHYYNWYSTARSCVLWGNARSLGDGIHIAFSDVEGSGGSAGWILTGRDLVDEGGNIDTNPLYGVRQTGVWTADATYDAGTDSTTLTDTNSVRAANSCRGAWVSIGTANRYAYRVISNTATQFVVLGNAAAAGTNGATYELLDVHLQSRQGRWTPEGWVRDPVNSPCIDAGDTNSPVGLEPEPNGGRINMGVYGGTAEASKTYVPARGTVIKFR